MKNLKDLFRCIDTSKFVFMLQHRLFNLTPKMLEVGQNPAQVPELLVLELAKRLYCK